MRHLTNSLLVATALLAASGCTQSPTREQAGGVVGGVAGGLLGAQVGSGTGQLAATAAGALLGFMIGGSIGRTMDEVDRMKVSRSLEHTPTGQPNTWRNPDSGNVYTVTPTATRETASGPCREYVIDANVGGKRDEVYGTACRQADGSWQVQS